MTPVVVLAPLGRHEPGVILAVPAAVADWLIEERLAERYTPEATPTRPGRRQEW